MLALSALLAGLLVAAGLSVWPRSHRRVVLAHRVCRRMATVAFAAAAGWGILVALALASEAASTWRAIFEGAAVAVVSLGALALVGFAVHAWRHRPRAVPPVLRAALDAAAASAPGRSPEVRRLLARIRWLAWRLTLLGTVQVLMRALLAGAAVALVFVLVDRLLVDTGLRLELAVAVALLLAVAGGLLVAALFAVTSPLAAAARADAELALRERLSTVLTLSGERSFEQAVRRDALRHLDEARLITVGRMRWPWQGSAAMCLGLLLVLAVLVLPQPRWLTPQAQPQRQAQLDAERFDRAVEILSAQREPMRQLAEEHGTEETREIVGEFERVAGERQRREDPESPSEADVREEMARLSEIQERIREAQRNLAAMQRDMARMREEAARHAEEAGRDGAANEFQQALSRGAFDEARDAAEQMAQQTEQAQRLAEQDPASAEAQQAREQMEQLAEALREMAEGMDQANPLKPDLAEAAEGMCSGDAAQAREALARLEQRLADWGSESRVQLNQRMLEMLDEQVQQAREQFGQCLNPGGGEDGSESAQAGAAGSDDEEGGAGAWEQLQAQLAAGDGGCCGAGAGLGQGSAGSGNDGSGANVGSGLGSGQGGGGGPRGTAELDEEPQLLPWLQAGELQAGDIVATMRRMGQPEAGEARHRYRRAYDEALRRNEDAMTRYALPSEYRRLVQDYFRQINPSSD